MPGRRAEVRAVVGALSWPTLWVKPGDILIAADVPDGALVSDGEGDCWVRASESGER